MPLDNKKFTWDTNMLKRFYEKYVINWLHRDQNWTQQEKLQAVKNIGLENVDTNFIIKRTNQNSIYIDNAGNDPGSNYNASVFGTGNTVTNYGAFCGGFSCTTGNRAATFNTDNTASGTNTFACGSNTTAAGEYSHTEGFSASTSIQGQCAHAEGKKTQANASGAHAENEETVASGINSHAGGYRSIASGKRGFAHGYQCSASSENGVAIGTALSTQNDGEAAFGRFNQTRSGLQFSVGNGTSNSDRRNVFEVENLGDIYIIFNNARVSLQGLFNAFINSIESLGGTVLYRAGVAPLHRQGDWD